MRASEVVRRTGVSYRRLDYWTRSGWVRPRYRYVGTGSGYPRDWSEADLERVLEIRDAFADAARALEGARLPVPPPLRSAIAKRRRAA